MNCIYCEKELPSGAKFCPKCTNQIICLDCGAALINDSSICIFCGVPLKRKSNLDSSGAINNIEFTENEKGKSFRASFTDTVAGNVVETFAQLLPISNYSSKRMLQESKDINYENADYIKAEVLESNQVPLVHSIPQDESPSNDLTELEKIFRNKNDIISIYDPRIKAKSKSDFIGRITLLFLYYKELLGNGEVKRAELNYLLDKENLKDAIIRTYLSSNQKLITSDQTTLELRPEGKEQAQKILLEFRDSDIPNVWDLKSSKTNGKRSAKDNIEHVALKKETKNKKNFYVPKILGSLNLKPKDKQALTDFYSSYKPSSFFENNLLFVYYIQKILEESNITIDHVYTCYKDVNIKVSNNLYQSLIDTGKNKSWIDTTHMNNLRITIQGENYVEHDMTKS